MPGAGQRPLRRDRRKGDAGRSDRHPASADGGDGPGLLHHAGRRPGRADLHRRRRGRWLHGGCGSCAAARADRGLAAAFGLCAFLSQQPRGAGALAGPGAGQGPGLRPVAGRRGHSRADPGRRLPCRPVDQRQCRGSPRPDRRATRQRRRRRWRGAVRPGAARWCAMARAAAIWRCPARPRSTCPAMP